MRAKRPQYLLERVQAAGILSAPTIHPTRSQVNKCKFYILFYKINIVLLLWSLAARSGSRPTPSATAVYDFDPENPGELGFKVWMMQLLVVSLQNGIFNETLFPVFIGGRPHHSSEPHRRKLVRRQRQRSDGLLPRQLCAGHRPTAINGIG